jgi:hypothetical protein
VTEEEWVGCTGPGSMLEFLRGKCQPRKKRLFAVACCSRLATLYPNETLLAGIAAAERYADGVAKKLERHTINTTGLQRTADTVGVFQAAFVLDRLLSPSGYDKVKSRNDDSVAQLVDRIAGVLGHPGLISNKPDQFSGERRTQADLLRCIFGNPLCPVVLNRSWQTTTVVSLAQAIYDDGAFDRLPILADALEDAGCTNQEVLAHCRGEGPHVRGCWLIDLLLQKE